MFRVQLLSLLVVAGAVGALPAKAADGEAALGVRVTVALADDAVVEEVDAALLAQGNPAITVLRISRTGRLISIRNEKSAPVCAVRLEPEIRQDCFGKAFVIGTVLPLSSFGAASHPFVLTAKVGGWPVAIYAGLDGIPRADWCRRFVATISFAAATLARTVCPDTVVATPEAISGTTLLYSFGTGATRQAYSVRLGPAAHGDEAFSVFKDGAPLQRTGGPAAVSRIFGLIVRCERLLQDLSAVVAGQERSCERASHGMAWRDTVTFVGGRTLNDGTVAATLRTWRLSIAGTSENAHRSVAETEIWLELGAPLRTRYIVVAGQGPDDLPPARAYTEALQQITLPAP
jgi:hypothetical protein